MSTVVPAILDIYQNLLGVQFETIQNASTWHPGMFVSFSITLNLNLMILEDVQAFSVWEKDAKDASGFVGYCYLDLFPRGMHFFPHRLCPFDSRLNRGEIFACCCLAPLGWL